MADKITFQAWVREMLNKRILMMVIAPTLWFLGAIGFGAAVYVQIVWATVVLLSVYLVCSAAKCIAAMLTDAK